MFISNGSSWFLVYVLYISPVVSVVYYILIYDVIMLNDFRYTQLVCITNNRWQGRPLPGDSEAMDANKESQQQILQMTQFILNEATI